MTRTVGGAGAALLLLLLLAAAHGWDTNGRARRTVLPPSTVHVSSKRSDTTFVLVGCMHSSTSSAEDASHVIDRVRPAAVMLELCPSRFNRLVEDLTFAKAGTELGVDEPSRWAALLGNARTAFARGGMRSAVLWTLLSAGFLFQQTESGAEFKAAVRAARRLPGCDVVLGDQEVFETVRAISFHRPWSGQQRRGSAWHALRRDWRSLWVGVFGGPPWTQPAPNVRVSMPHVVFSDGQRARELAGLLLPNLMIAGLLVGLASLPHAQGPPAESWSAAVGVPVGVAEVLASIVVLQRVVNTVLTERNEILAGALRRTASLYPRGSTIVAVVGMLHVNCVAELLESGIEEGLDAK